MNQIEEMEMIIDEQVYPKCSIHQDKFISNGCLQPDCNSRLMCQKCILKHPHLHITTEYYQFLSEFIKKNKGQAKENLINSNVKTQPFQQYIDQQYFAKFTKQIDDQLTFVSNFFQKINEFVEKQMQETMKQLKDFKLQFESKYKEFIKEYQKINQSAKCIHYFTPNVLNSKLIQQGPQANDFLNLIANNVGDNFNELNKFKNLVEQKPIVPDSSELIRVFKENFNTFINNKNNYNEIIDFNKLDDSTAYCQQKINNDQQVKKNQSTTSQNNINQYQVIQNVQSSTQEIQVTGLDVEKQIYELEFKSLNKFKKLVVTSILLLSQNLLVFLQKDKNILTLFDFTKDQIIDEVNLKINNTWLLALNNEFFISGSSSSSNSSSKSSSNKNNTIQVLKFTNKSIQLQSEIELGKCAILQALNLGSLSFVVVNSEGTIFYYNLNNKLTFQSEEFKEVKNLEKKKNLIRLTLIEQFLKFGVYISGESTSFIFQIDETYKQIRKIKQSYKAPTIIWRNPVQCYLLSSSGLTIAKDEKSELEDREVDTIIITQDKTTYIIALPISQGQCKRFIVNHKDLVLTLDQPEICEQVLNQYYFPRIQVFKANSGKINVLIANPDNVQSYLTLFEINFK